MSISSIINVVPSFTQGSNSNHNSVDELCFSSFYHDDDCNNNDNTCNGNKRKQEFFDSSPTSSVNSVELSKKRRTEEATNDETFNNRRRKSSIDIDVLLAFGALCVPVIISNQERQELQRKENETENEHSSDTNTPSQESPSLTPSGTPPSSPVQSPSTSPRKSSKSATKPSPQSSSNHITEFFENQWHGRFLELKHYREKFGHTNVTRTAKEWKSLGNWVAEQRRKFRKGKMPQEQYDKLDSIGFEWDRKYYFNPGQCKNY